MRLDGQWGDISARRGYCLSQSLWRGAAWEAQGPSASIPQRTKALLDKLNDDGRYQLTPLGQATHRLLKFTAMTAESQAEALEEPEEVRPEPATPEEGLRIVSDIDTLLLNKERLDRYDHVADRSISQTK